MVQVIDLERKLTQASGNRELGEFLLEGLSHWFDACGILLIKSDMLMGWQATEDMVEVTGTFEDVVIGRGESTTIERIIKRKSFYAGPWPEDFFIHPLIRAWRPPADKTCLIFPITVMGQVRMLVLGWSSLPMGPAIYTTVIELLEKAGWRFGQLIIAKKRSAEDVPLGTPLPQKAQEPQTPQPEVPSQQTEEPVAAPQPEQAAAVPKQQPEERITQPSVPAEEPAEAQQMPKAEDFAPPEPQAEPATEEPELPAEEEPEPPTAAEPEPEAPKSKRVPELMLPVEEEEEEETIADEGSWADLSHEAMESAASGDEESIPKDAFAPITEQDGFDPYGLEPDEPGTTEDLPPASMTVEISPEEAAEMVKKAAAAEVEPDFEAPMEDTVVQAEPPSQMSRTAANGPLNNWSQVFKASKTGMKPVQPAEKPVAKPAQQDSAPTTTTGQTHPETGASTSADEGDDRDDDGIPIKDIRFIDVAAAEKVLPVKTTSRISDQDLTMPPPDTTDVTTPADDTEAPKGETLVTSDEVIIQAASSDDMDILTRENVMPDSAEKRDERKEAVEVHNLELSGKALESQTISRRERVKTQRMFPEQETAPEGGYISDSVGNHQGKDIDWGAHIPVEQLLKDRARYLRDQHESTATLSGYRFNDEDFLTHLQSLAQDEASATLRTMLESDDVFDRFYGAYAASVVYGPGMTSRLIDLLYDDDDAVMTMASRVLLTRRGDADFEEFRDGLLDDLQSDDVETVLDAVFMLGMIKDPLAVRPLMGMLDTSDDPGLIIEAMTRISCQYPGGDKYAWQAWWRANRDLTQSEWFIFALTRGAPALAREAQACLHALHGSVVPWTTLDEPANRATAYDQWREFWDKRTP